jgi:hypothetical protein
MPVVAYRSWYTYPTERVLVAAPVSEPHQKGLYSTSVGYRWKPGENVASCKPFLPWADGVVHSDYPGEGCSCGFHACAIFEEAPRWVFYGGQLFGRPFVVGAVVLWGDLRSGGSVIRASHAAVVALMGEGNPQSKELAAMYGVPVCESEAELRYEATEYGNELTPEQLEELRETI